MALIETTAAVCVEKFTDYPQLGRFTLRDEGRTIAIGKVNFNSKNETKFVSPNNVTTPDHKTH